jgi:hypothetical protein
MPDTISLRALNRATLARQLLLEPSKLSARAALEQVGGLQAQWPKPPFIGLWTRLATFERDDLSSLLRKRQAIRATMMRATIHIMSTKDFVATRPVLQAVLTRGLAPIQKRAEEIDVDAVTKAARDLFKTARTFEDARDALVAKFPKANDRALGHIARMMVPLVMVPSDDDPWAFPSIAQFQLAESWLEKPIPAVTDPSALVLRYFAAFGPASIADAQCWSGLQSLRAVDDKLRPKLKTFRDERGRELFDVPEGPRPDEATPAPIRFLQEFDNVLMGYQERARILDDSYKPFVLLPGLRVASTILVDGRIAASWKVERVKKRAVLSILPFQKMSKQTAADVSAEGMRLCQFMDPDAMGYDINWALKK